MSKYTSVKHMRTAKHAFGLFQNRKTLWQMLREASRGQYRMSFFTYLALIFGALYIISPLDFDWIPVVGWVDDGFIALLVIKRLMKETQRYNRFKAMERKSIS